MQSASHTVSTSIVVSIIWVLSDSLVELFGYITLYAISPASRKTFLGLTPGFPIQSNLYDWVIQLFRQKVPNEAIFCCFTVANLLGGSIIKM